MMPNYGTSTFNTLSFSKIGYSCNKINLERSNFEKVYRQNVNLKNISYTQRCRLTAEVKVMLFLTWIRKQIHSNEQTYSVTGAAKCWVLRQQCLLQLQQRCLDYWVLAYKEYSECLSSVTPFGTFPFAKTALTMRGIFSRKAILLLQQTRRYQTIF